MKQLLHLVEPPEDLIAFEITAFAVVTLILGFVLGGLAGVAAGKQTVMTARQPQLPSRQPHDGHPLDVDTVTATPSTRWQLSLAWASRPGRHRRRREQMRWPPVVDVS